MGNVENTLFINTSNHGVFTYQVRELHSFRKVVKCESTRAVSIMACLTIQGYLHNSGGVFFISPAEEVYIPASCCNTEVYHCKYL